MADKIISYISETPENTNPAVLHTLLGDLNKQSDWNQNDETQPDYIKNRPFYADLTETEWFPETSVSIDTDEVMISSTFQNEITVGNTYSVTFDGTTTEYIGTKFDMSGQSIVYFGDDFAQVLQGAIKGTVYSAKNGMLIMSTTNETLIGATHTISIREISEQIIQIDKKYIPSTPEFVVDATKLPTDATAWGELYTALQDAYDSGYDIFLDIYGDGSIKLKLTNRRDVNYLFLYPDNSNTIHAYILRAMPSDGGSLTEISLSTKEYVDTAISNALGVIENGTY